MKKIASQWIKTFFKDLFPGLNLSKSPDNSSDLRPTQLWGLRLGFHLAIMNNDTKPSLRNNVSKEVIKETIKVWWHVANRHDAMKTIDWLVEEGHRKAFGNEEIIAWDFGRLVRLARFFFSADYISEEEAWQLIKYAALTVQPLFNSWKEYHESYALGRKLWLKSWNEPEEPEEFMLQMQRQFRYPDKSLIKNLPWKMVLIWETPANCN
jgi:hypothetical protein